MTLPIHMRRKDGTPVVIVAQDRKFGPNSAASVIYLYINHGYTYVGYAMADGTNPNNTKSSDLVPYDTTQCATHVQSVLESKVYGSMLHLWHAGHHDEVVAVAAKGTTFHPSDMRHYLTTLWGN